MAWTCCGSRGEDLISWGGCAPVCLDLLLTCRPSWTLHAPSGIPVSRRIYVCASRCAVVPVPLQGSARVVHGVGLFDSLLGRVWRCCDAGARGPRMWYGVVTSSHAIAVSREGEAQAARPTERCGAERCAP